MSAALWPLCFRFAFALTRRKAMSRKRGQFRLVVFGHGPSHLDALSLWPPMSNQTTKVDIRGGRLGACSSRPPALFISCMCSRLPAAASVCQALVVNQVKLSASLAAVSVSHLHFAQLLCSSVFGPMTLRPLAPPTKSVSLSLLSARILRASADLPQLLPPSPPADLLSRI